MTGVDVGDARRRTATRLASSVPAGEPNTETVSDVLERRPDRLSPERARERPLD